VKFGCRGDGVGIVLCWITSTVRAAHMFILKRKTCQVAIVHEGNRLARRCYCVNAGLQSSLEFPQEMRAGVLDSRFGGV